MLRLERSAHQGVEVRILSPAPRGIEKWYLTGLITLGWVKPARAVRFPLPLFLALQVLVATFLNGNQGSGVRFPGRAPEQEMGSSPIESLSLVVQLAGRLRCRRWSWRSASFVRKPTGFDSSFRLHLPI